MSLFIGSHLRTQKTLTETYVHAINRKCTAFQIYLNNHQPSEGFRKKFEDSDIEQIISSGLDKHLVFRTHCPLHYSLANREKFAKIKNSLQYELGLMYRLNNTGSVIHPGTATNHYNYEAALQDCIISILELYNVEPGEDDKIHLGQLLLENSAGEGNKLPADLFSMWRILNACDQYPLNTKLSSSTISTVGSKVGVCLDTAHIQGKGDYDLSSIEGIDKLYQDIQNMFGIDRIGVIHLNDSKVELGSRKDRHAPLCFGKI